MVKLTKIYTRTGDQGTTALSGGARVSKSATRIDVIGTLDEANAAVGLARLHTTGTGDDMLARIQNDLFDLGADIATRDNENRTMALRIVQSQVTRLEIEIDQMNSRLAPLNSFVLPGGSPASAYLHLARTLVRRAERAMVALTETEQINPIALAYCNRLSDHFFVLSRHLNDNGDKDVLWRPGGDR